MKPFIRSTFLSLLIILPVSVQCQTEFSANTFYATFRGINYHNFKPTAGVNFEYSKNNLVYGISYLKFEPRADTLYFADDSPKGYGTICFEDYYNIPIYVGLILPTDIGKKLRITPGIQAGYTLVYYEYIYDDSEVDLQETVIGGRFAISGRVSLAYKINRKLSVFMNTKYNMNWRESVATNTSSGGLSDLHHYLTFGAGVSYKIRK